MASGRYDQLKSLKRRVAAAGKKKQLASTGAREMWDMTDDELIAHLEKKCACAAPCSECCWRSHGDGCVFPN
eukprot:m.752955 g.752955  ORF g.752955 m.752955 type:complete len:72 (+) comp23171_c0_seq17:1749-1964(+)